MAASRGDMSEKILSKTKNTLTSNERGQSKVCCCLFVVVFCQMFVDKAVL
jgi:hypothetical protein